MGAAQSLHGRANPGRMSMGKDVFCFVNVYAGGGMGLARALLVRSDSVLFLPFFPFCQKKS
jgi:hypothetical protein